MNTPSSTSSSQPPPPSQPSSKETPETPLEKTGIFFDTARLWVIKSWKMGLMMAKGAYLLSERRRLFGRLGEEVYFRSQKGEMRQPELDPMILEIDRLSKKVELEERMIRSVRFGSDERRARQREASSSAPPSGV